MLSVVSSYFLLFAEPPSAPRHLTVVSNSSSTIELNFAQPALDGGSAVVDYTVNCTRDVGLPHFISVTTTGLSVNATNVYSGENYTCSVRARNVVGFGPAASVTVMLLKGGTLLVSSFIAYLPTVLDCMQVGNM